MENQYRRLSLRPLRVISVLVVLLLLRRGPIRRVPSSHRRNSLGTGLILQCLLNGLSMGLTYALMALGLTLLFGMMHIVNFAHGELLMLGAFCLYFLDVPLGMNYFLAFVLTLIILFLFGILLERTIFRPITGQVRPQIVASLGVSLIVMNLGYVAFGLKSKSVPSVIPGVTQIFGSFIAKERLMAMGFSLILVGVLYIVLHKTKVGRAIRAVQQNPEAAALQGVNIDRINALGWGLATALAAAGGALLAPLFSVHPAMGYRPASLAFIIVIVGGLGSIPGALCGALIIGLVESLVGTLVGSEFAWGSIFLIAILTILFRPQGLFKGYV
jgi:branched-chain amino acid transport system permease protein